MYVWQRIDFPDSPLGAHFGFQNGVQERFEWGVTWKMGKECWDNAPKLEESKKNEILNSITSCKSAINEYILPCNNPSSALFVKRFINGWWYKSMIFYLFLRENSCLTCVHILSALQFGMRYIFFLLSNEYREVWRQDEFSIRNHSEVE